MTNDEKLNELRGIIELVNDVLNANTIDKDLKDRTIEDIDNALNYLASLRYIIKHTK